MSNNLPKNLYSCEQTRELARLCIEEHGIAGIVLMKRAGRAAFDFATERWLGDKNKQGSWTILCGSGNNAGDGYIFAGLAAQRCHKVTVYSAAEPGSLKGDALKAFEFAQQLGVDVKPFDSSLDVDEGSVVIDALLGTGYNGPLRESYLEAINWVNACQSPVLSLDVPSGLCGDTGAVNPTAVRATATVTFIGVKIGLLTGRGPAFTGEMHFTDLDLPKEVYKSLKPIASRIDLANTDGSLLSEYDEDAHKGSSGHLMVVGGDHGYGGACLMTAESAAYAGASIVGLATRAEHVAPALVRRPEIMAIGVASGQEIEPLLEKPEFIVVGPGLGLSPWSEQMLQQVLATGKPAVIDADALTILASGRLKLPQQSSNIVITPHPGEAARLLGTSASEVQSDRIAAIKALQEKFSCVVVLKGAGTLIYDGEDLIVANVGNKGLATAGTGDILSGVIGACMAQGLSAFDAAKYAVCLHGAAADLLVEDVGMRGLLASELCPYIRELM